MSKFDEQIIFDDKSLSDLFKDIYKNSKKTEKQISELIMNLSPMITSPGDAIIIVPLIKEYMEVKVKNDEHLVKMAAIVQRAFSSGNDEDGFLISDAEKEELLREVKNMEKEQQKLIADKTK